ncbi:MAG: tRNA uridine-5-carboxymethylaminomethyl(34) synthesis GTPase MnmE [Vampirovibrionales bacterium]
MATTFSQSHVQLNDDATIVAIATAPGQAAIGVIRLSGSNAWQIADACFYDVTDPQHALPKRLKPFALHYGWWCQPHTPTAPIDEVLVLAFKAPKSFTGEDVIEIQCHGNPLLLEEILQSCYALGAVPATRGAFTRRAVLHGRLDLTQAESLLQLIHAQEATTLHLARHHLQTRSWSDYLEKAYQAIQHIQMQLIAHIDYPEEVDAPNIETLHQAFQQLHQEVKSYLATAQHLQKCQEGLKLAIIGLPNAGKSSLFNRLLMQERAIVTPIAGTTRDILQETLMVSGVNIALMDTAGIRYTHTEGTTLDTVEAIGVARSEASMQEADAILMVIDASLLFPETPSPETQAYEVSYQTLVRPLQKDASQKPWLVVLNHADKLLPLKPRPAMASVIDKLTLPTPSVHTETPSQVTLLYSSAITGEGIEAICQWMQTLVATLNQTEALRHRQEALAVLTHRQRTTLHTLLDHLALAQTTLEQALPLDLLTVPLTGALQTLGSLLGKDATEAVLDEVFSQFCVGK